MTAIETIVGAVTVRAVDCDTPAKPAEMLVEPAATAVTIPLALTVAVAGVEELQLTSDVKSALLPSLYVPVAVNCWLVFTGMDEAAGVIEIETKLAAAAVMVKLPLDVIEPDCA